MYVVVLKCSRLIIVRVPYTLVCVWLCTHMRDCGRADGRTKRGERSIIRQSVSTYTVYLHMCMLYYMHGYRPFVRFLFEVAACLTGGELTTIIIVQRAVCCSIVVVLWCSRSIIARGCRRAGGRTNERREESGRSLDNRCVHHVLYLHMCMLYYIHVHAWLCTVL